ncbi:MAG: DUF4236 domain-containing protein [Verrucomicrobiales bacterium]
MGWTYRKSVRAGPFRINLSGKGIGYSVGVGGFRTGRNARGRNYTTFSLPGTGLSYRKSGVGCLIFFPFILGAGFTLKLLLL